MLFLLLQGSENGTVINSVTEIQEIQKTIVKEGSESFDVSQQRVFLIGENRWEDPTRLHSSNGKASDGKTKVISTNCLTCRGEGRLLCTGTSLSTISLKGILIYF